MRRDILVACVGICSLVVLSTGWAQRVPGEPPRERQGEAQRGPQMERRGEPGLPPDLAAAADELNLTAEQRAAAEAAVRETQAALTEWDAQNRETVTRLQTEMRAAAGGSGRGDMRNGGGGGGELRALMMARRQIEMTCEGRVMAVLTPEQRLEFGGIRALNDREFQGMLAALKLPPDEEAALKEKIKVAGIASAKWDMENGDKVRNLEAQMEALQVQLQPLREERARLEAQGKAGVFASLTPEQKNTLLVAQLYGQVTGMGRSIQLSEAQLATVWTLCEKLVQDAGPALQTNPRSVGQLREKLFTTILEEILTDDQRAQIQDRR